MARPVSRKKVVVNEGVKVVKKENPAKAKAKAGKTLKANVGTILK